MLLSGSEPGSLVERAAYKHATCGTCTSCPLAPKEEDAGLSVIGSMQKTKELVSGTHGVALAKGCWEKTVK